MVGSTHNGILGGSAKVALLCAVVFGVHPIPARGEWPQWRGPERDGSVASGTDKSDWPDRLVKLWERKVGEGHSGPVIAGERVWIHTRRGDRELVSALSLHDGEPVWEVGYEAPFRQDPSARGHGRGPYSTPALADGRLFTLGVVGVLSAWNAEDGSLLWRREYSDEFEPGYPYFGAAGSPLVWDELCFVHFGSSEEQTPGNPGHGAMVALRVENGEEEWRWSEDGPALGASPLLRLVGERLQLVFKTKENIVGLDPRTGKELWRIPFKVGMDNTIVTPLFVGDRLLTSDWEMGFRAWQIESDGERWSARELWTIRSVSLFTSSPVVAAGQVVGFSNLRRGQLFGLDPATGKVLWRGEGRRGEHASLVARGDEVLVFLDNGSLEVGEMSGDRFHSLREYRVGRSGMWGHPAVLDDRIVVKDGDRLVVYRFRE